jgi:hypothetical protein
MMGGLKATTMSMAVARATTRPNFLLTAFLPAHRATVVVVPGSEMP